MLQSSYPWKAVWQPQSHTFLLHIILMPPDFHAPRWAPQSDIHSPWIIDLSDCSLQRSFRLCHKHDPPELSYLCFLAHSGKKIQRNSQYTKIHEPLQRGLHCEHVCMLGLCYTLASWFQVDIQLTSYICAQCCVRHIFNAWLTSGTALEYHDSRYHVLSSHDSVHFCYFHPKYESIQIWLQKDWFWRSLEWR